MITEIKVIPGSKMQTIGFGVKLRFSGCFYELKIYPDFRTCKMNVTGKHIRKVIGRNQAVDSFAFFFDLLRCKIRYEVYIRNRSEAFTQHKTNAVHKCHAMCLLFKTM